MSRQDVERYLDAKYSRWLSTDPALADYIPAAGKGTADEAGKLPGIGGAFNSVNGNLYHYAGNNPVKYVDPDGKTLYVCGSKQYMAAVQRELRNICSGAIVNFDTGEVSLSASSAALNPNGYDLLSTLIDSDKTNTIWLGNSTEIKPNGKLRGNSCVGYSSSRITLKDGKFHATAVAGPKNSLINFDPDNWNGGYDDNGSTNRPPFVGLAHEMGHSEANNNGTQTYEPYAPTPGTTPEKERNSIKRENEIRKEHNLTLRSFYYYQPRVNQEE